MKNKIVISSGILILLLCAAVILIKLHKAEGTEDWQQIKPQILPQLVLATHKERLNIANQPLSTGIDIAYVIDKFETYDFIVEDDLETWEIDETILHNTAMKNLEKIAAATKLEVASANEKKTEKYIIVEVDDGYAAVRLLSENIRRMVAHELGDTFVAGIPTRDFLIFWHKNFSLGDAFGEQVQKEFDAGSRYKLTPNLFVVSPDAIGMMTNTSAQ